jgi:hypothetical protein
LRITVTAADEAGRTGTLCDAIEKASKDGGKTYGVRDEAQ